MPCAFQSFHSSINHAMRGLVLTCKCISFFLLWTALFVGTNVNIYLPKKLGIANWPIKGKKQYFMLFCSWWRKCQTNELNKAMETVMLTNFNSYEILTYFKLLHTKLSIYFKYPAINVHWTFLVATWAWL